MTSGNKQNGSPVFKEKQPFFSFVKSILKLFFKKPKKIINLAGEIDSKSIIVVNHNAKYGPLYLELYFPLRHCLWGAGEMLGNYKSRFLYLRDVYYMQKKKHGKVFASFAAAFEAIFSPAFYKGMRVLPTYNNSKLLGTINKSIRAINEDTPVMIFPENSNEGYFDELVQFFPGFVLLSQTYYHKTGVDLPVYPVYYHTQKRILIIDKPHYIGDYIKQGLDRGAIAEIFKQRVNELYHIYVENGSAQ